MEKRAVTRIPLKTKALVRHGGTTITGTIQNLSLTGIFLKSSEIVKTNGVVKVEILFTGPSSQLSIILDGIVTRHDHKAMAIEFRNMDIDSFFHLRNLISYSTDDMDKVKAQFQEFVANKNSLGGT
ncbi:MAG: PilZ domain-containing protein [Deltaproteobacteria bacterium]|jgi:hypothetical protein|nr:PilZ domain-containing protein [Deltaproteobacteria bacterium]